MHAVRPPAAKAYSVHGPGRWSASALGKETAGASSGHQLGIAPPLWTRRSALPASRRSRAGGWSRLTGTAAAPARQMPSRHPTQSAPGAKPIATRSSPPPRAAAETTAATRPARSHSSP